MPRFVPRPVGRRGIALALTLWVLVIAGSLLTVIVFLAFQDGRASGTDRRLHHASTRAEAGLVDVVSSWKPALLSRLLPQAFDSMPINGTSVTGAQEDWLGTIHRLSPGLLLVAVTARNGPSGFEQVATEVRLGWLVRSHPVAVELSAALEAGGVVAIGDGAQMSGRDQSSDTSGACPPPGVDVAGIEAESVTVAAGARLDGAPPTARRASGDTGLTESQRQAFEQLAATPTISLAGGSWFTGPVVTGAHCDAAPDLNWGDPLRLESPCSGFLPIVHVQGDATLLGGSGQGILLVDGDLVIRGPYRFFGLVMVAGTFAVATADSGVTIEGAVVAGRTGLAPYSTLSLVIAYSTCRLARALQTSGSLVPLASRSWKQLF